LAAYTYAVIITFDVYGTLFDWQHGMGHYLSFIGVSRDAFFEKEYAAVSSQKGFRKYSDILKSSLRATMGSAYSDDHGEGLVLAFAKSPPFPDTVLGLRRLKRLGHRLGVISNTERSLIKVTLSGLEEFFEWIVTAEDTGHYKPAEQAFTEAYRQMNVAVDQVLHVSAYPQYDLESASKIGIKTLLVDRYGYKWPAYVGDLTQVAGKLGQL
jgi:2-haloacid dehalogenase